MRAGEPHASYRAPCAGWRDRPRVSLSCNEHRIAAHTAVPKWTNVTKVTDYHTDNDANPVALEGVRPYPKPQNTGLPTGCTDPAVPIPFCAGEPPTPANNDRKCGAWTNAEKPAPVNDATHVTIDGNIYERSAGETVDLSVCRKLGHKGVQARKFHHGTYSYDSEFHGAPDGWCELPCGCPIRNEKVYADQTKYLTLSIRAESERNYAETGNPPYQGTSFAARAFTVNRYSGVRTLTNWEEFIDGTPGSTYGIGDIQACRNFLEGGPTSFNIFSLAQTWCTAAGTDLGGGMYGMADVAYSGSGGVYNAKGYLDYGDPGTPDLRLAKEVDVNMGSGQLKETTYNYSVSETRYTESWRRYEVAGTHMVVEKYFFEGSGHTTSQAGSVGRWERIVADLSDPYTHNQCYADMVQLLAEWNLADDAQYSWREDDYENVQPLVTRNETLYASRPDAGVAVPADWVDDQIAVLTARGFAPGAIVGSPLPAGFGPHFNWHHQTWRMCRDDLGIEQFYVSHKGAWSGEANESDSQDSFMPRTATQWTENDGVIFNNYFLMPRPGAWLSSHGTGTTALPPGCLVGQKWAEVVQRRPSQNFFRPCGEDRTRLDPNQTRCIDAAASSGTDIRLVGSGIDVQTGDECVVAGFGETGIWTVQRVTGTRYTLVEKKAELPTGWETRGAQFGRVLYPAAWPVCGRVAVTGATNAAPIVLTLKDAAPDLRTGDRLNVTEVLGNTAANGANRQVTRVDDTHFELDGSSGNGVYTSGGYAQSPGSPAYQWHDNQSKGDYALLTWEFDYRYVGENLRLVAQHAACGTGCTGMSVDNPGVRRRLPVGWGMPENPRYWQPGQERCEVSSVTCAGHCVAHQACVPAVVCISPNYHPAGTLDKFPNGTTHPFPETFRLDETYSSFWQRAVQQAMDDKLWQPPPRPCDVPGSFLWVEDDGVCTEDGVMIGLPPLPAYFYAMRPFVELRCSLPVGAPALAAGYLGCLSIAQLDVAVITEPGNVCPPPDFQGLILNPGIVHWRVRQTVWGVWLRQHGCIELGGRWSEEYLANGAG